MNSEAAHEGNDFHPHVLVTGAASGIGHEIATRFAADGARLTLVDFDEKRLAAVRAELDVLTEVTAVTADLRAASAISRVYDMAWAAGPVHVLVNSAGIYPAVPYLETTAEVWDAVQAINVRAPMLMTVEFARRWEAAEPTAWAAPDEAARSRSVPAGYPNVVNISSGAALRARPGAAPYSTSKAAVEMVTRASALELGPFGIRVNAVAPGFIAVDSEINRLTEDYVAQVSVNPLGRTGRPSDIAHAVQWITSSAAEWITGEVLRVDGGSSTGTMALPISWPETVTELDTNEHAAGENE